MSEIYSRALVRREDVGTPNQVKTLALISELCTLAFAKDTMASIRET